MPALFLAFALVPLIEVVLLVQIGEVAGTYQTVLLVLVMAVLGAVLAKSQGRKVLREWRGALAEGRVPEEGVLGGILVLVGGVLLITPGVLTDFAGFVCLFPPTRRWLARRLQHHLAGQVARGQASVHAYGFEWPPRPAPSPQAKVGPAVQARARAPRPSPLERPIRPGDVIDTEGEEVE